MKIDKNLIGGTTDLLLLSLLSEKDCYGYEIIRTLDERSNSTFQFKEGTLYPVLHRLENQGYLRSYKMAGDTGKERKYYTLTPSGLEQLEEEKNMWNCFSDAVNKVTLGTNLQMG